MNINPANTTELPRLPATRGPLAAVAPVERVREAPNGRNPDPGRQQLPPPLRRAAGDLPVPESNHDRFLPANRRVQRAILAYDEVAQGGARDELDRLLGIYEVV